MKDWIEFWLTVWLGALILASPLLYKDGNFVPWQIMLLPLGWILLMYLMKDWDI